MSDLFAATAVLPAERITDDDLTHIVCEHDEDTALCGTDLTGADWDDEDGDCIVCQDLDDYYDQIGACCSRGEEVDRD